MDETHDVRRMLEAAEQAASAGDLAGAEAALRDAARLQEAELGPLHPDLASTLNNLAVVTEKTGRPDDAEALFRQAFAIASASLPADDPTVTEIRQNLEDFCRARGVPFEKAAQVEAVEVSAPVEAVPISRPAAPIVEPDATSPAAAPIALEKDSQHPPAIAIVIGAAIALMFVAFLILRARSTPEVATQSPAAAPAPPPAAEPPRATVTPPQGEATPPTASTKPAPVQPSADVALVSAQLCRNLSSGDGSWRCDPAGDSPSSGPLVLYTRVRSARDDVVVHRWFKGDALRKSAQLRIRANPTDGFRTYSRQTVDAGEWRVEVRTAGGALLHEQRVTVR
jgi:hypothetical protein